MNFRQLQYAVHLSQVLNFSLVAEQFHISQPALSKQIISLEEEINVRLFDRSTTPIKLTPAGEHFIQNAKELLYHENQLLRTMEQFQMGERGQLTIGISPFRSLYILSDTIKKLNRKFPKLKIVLEETNSIELHKGAIEGRFDFAIMNLPVDETQLDVYPLDIERRVLAVPHSMANGLPRKVGNDFPSIDLADCKELPFIVLPKGSEMRDLFDSLCMEANFKPNITTEVVGITTAWALARSGIAATLLPLQFLESNRFSEDLDIFFLRQEMAVKHPVIAIKKGQYLSQYALAAIECLSSV